MPCRILVVNSNTTDSVTARIADAQERARLWPLITEDHDNYAGYQKKTDREIPLVLLTPQA